MKFNRLILAVMLSGFVFSSCEKPEEKPQEPAGGDREEFADYAEGETTTFKSFTLTAAANQGKILPKQVVYKNGRTKTEEVKEQKLKINGKEISLCIPYLYDFALVPSFALGADYEVYAAGEKQVSGKSEVDFTSPVEYLIVDKEKKVKTTYTVTISNTGLPIVVLDQKGDYAQNVNFLDMTVPAKECSFGSMDEIAIYKDGKAVLEKMNCGFRLRGNITRQYPKKAFALKLASKKSVLGMKAHKRWNLLANWKDNTQLRNDLALHLARQFSAMAWNPSGEFVELVLNGEHIGTYYLCEHIKIDKNRLNISKPYEDQTAPTFDNCGYLLEFDNYFDEAYKFRINGKSTLPVNCKDDFDSSAEGQAIFRSLQSRLETLDNLISSGRFSEAYENYLDIDASVDYMLLQELVMNNEYKHPRSCYAWLDGGKDKLHFGPCWDYDVWTFPDIDKIRWYNSENYVHKYDRFQFETEVMNTASTYVWFKLLMKDGTFKSRVRDRWKELSALEGLSPDAIDLYIDNRVKEIGTSVGYNREMWPHPSQEYGDEYMNGDETTDSYGNGRLYEYDETISFLKGAYRKRFNGLATATSR